MSLIIKIEFPVRIISFGREAMLSFRDMFLNATGFGIRYILAVRMKGRGFRGSVRARRCEKFAEFEKKKNGDGKCVKFYSF